MLTKNNSKCKNTIKAIAIFAPIWLIVYFIYLFGGRDVEIPSIGTSMDYLKIPETFACVNRPLEASIEEKNSYLVYYNIIPAKRRFNCDESVTITTMGDYTFLDNLVPLVERWRGPISVALYCPGLDLFGTLQSIDYLRQCTSDLVKDLVTFHLFHERLHLPQLEGGILSHIDKVNKKTNIINCNRPPIFRIITKEQTYRSIAGLPFGINLARNIARRGAQTHYFLASDLELYPSSNMIENFLQFIRRSPTLQLGGLVFALPLFEVKEGLALPSNKLALQKMLIKGEAAVFHEKFCSICHNVPNSKEWKERKAPISGEIMEFARAKRQGDFDVWEPFLIETHADPMHDERLNWEGAGDKMVQAYAMCLLNYDFVILENAFLVHKAGIKEKPPQSEAARNSSRLQMENLVKPELDALYGYREGCSMLRTP